MRAEIPEDEAVSMAVIHAVSDATATDPCSLPPLANKVDPDALDALFTPLPDGTARSGGQFSFEYADHRVTVDNGKYLTVRQQA